MSAMASNSVSDSTCLQCPSDSKEVNSNPQNSLDKNLKSTLTMLHRSTEAEESEARTEEHRGSATAEQLRKRQHGINVFKTASVQPIPNVLTAKRPEQKRVWLFALIFATVACFVHMYFLLETFIMSPNAISITYERKMVLSLPRLHVCDRKAKVDNLRMLDNETLPNISSEYWYAMELGLGVVPRSDSVFLISNINITEMKLQYGQIVSDYGTISAAYMDFYAKYGRKCEDVFLACYYHFDHPVDCCQLFEPVFTLNGLCWVSKPGALQVSGIDSLANFRLRLKHNLKEYRPKFLEQKQYISLDETEDYESYRIGLMPRLDQGEVWSRAWVANAFQSMTISMMQRQRVLMDNEDVCVNDKFQLKYFMEYNNANCAIEKTLFENIDKLLNTSCELELVELLKPGYKAKNLCSFEQILDMIKYRQLEPKPVQLRVWNALMESTSALNISLADRMAGICDSPFKVNSTRICTLEDLKENKENLGQIASDQLSQVPFSNTGPKSLMTLAAELQAKHNVTDENTCLPLCNFTSHTLISETSKGALPTYMKIAQSELFLQYTTKEVELIQEEPRQSLSEYIAMIGGNIGLWNGASIISIGHLIFLIFKAAGIEPFGL